MPPAKIPHASDPSAALRAAVAAVGSQAEMARLLDISQPSVWKWPAKGKVLPAEHVLKVEAATGVSRFDLRPDLYPREAGAESPPADRYNGARA